MIDGLEKLSYCAFLPAVLHRFPIVAFLVVGLVEMLVVGTLGGKGCFDGHYGHSFLSRNSKRFTRSCEIDLLEALLQWEVFAGHFDLCDWAFFFVFDTVTAAQNFFSLAVRPFLLLRDLPGAELELLIVPAEELLVAEAIGVYCGERLKRESFLTDRAFLV